MTAETGDDRRLVMALSYAMRDDREAVSYLYCLFAEDVCAAVLSITDDASAAEELTRSLFADLPEVIAEYNPAVDGPFQGWLLETARQIALDRCRRA